MKNRKSIVRNAMMLIFMAIFCMSGYVNAQPPGPDSDPDEPDVPIDGGISLLVAAGAAYGVKKIKDGRKNGGIQK